MDWRIFAWLLLAGVALPLTSRSWDYHTSPRHTAGSQQPSLARAATTPPAFRLDGDIAEWRDLAPTLTLQAAQPGAREGKVWLSQSPEGLLIAGAVEGSAPRWPQRTADMALGDHIEIWLADSPPPQLPPIGWGNQFGETQLGSEEDCDPESQAEIVSSRASEAECRDWYRQQQQYRRDFRRLLVRQWQLAPGLSAETFASPAYLALSDSQQAASSPLRPSEVVPRARFAESPGAGAQAFSFELLIPWAAFPPLAKLELSQLRLLVDVFSPGTARLQYGPFASTSTARRYGDPDSFNHVELPSPRAYTLSECGYELWAIDPTITPYLGFMKLRREDYRAAYFLPGPMPQVNDVFVIRNPARGYAYAPYGHSPIVTSATYFSRHIGADAVVCGPPLRYVRGGRVVAAAEETLDPAFSAKWEPDGSFLLRNGPKATYTYFGSGQCGACPRVGLAIYRVDPGTGRIQRAFHSLEIAELPYRDRDIFVSDDWERLTVYTSRPEADYNEIVWSLEAYCLDRGSWTYELCEQRAPVPEPSPRNIIYRD